MLPDVRSRILILTSAILLSLGCITLAQSTSQPASVPTSELIPRSVLDQMYRRELGSLYRADDSGRLFQTHQSIEKYLAASALKDRDQIVRDIEAIGLGAKLVGRITRLHMRLRSCARRRCVNRAWNLSRHASNRLHALPLALLDGVDAHLPRASIYRRRLE